jgi:hypothetical protein
MDLSEYLEYDSGTTTEGEEDEEYDWTASLDPIAKPYIIRAWEEERRHHSHQSRPSPKILQYLKEKAREMMDRQFQPEPEQPGDEEMGLSQRLMGGGGAFYGVRAPASIVGDDNTGVFTSWDDVAPTALHGTPAQRAAMNQNYKKFKTRSRSIVLLGLPQSLGRVYPPPFHSPPAGRETVLPEPPD